MAPGKTPKPLLVEMFEVVLGAVKPPLVVPWTYSRRQLAALDPPAVVLAGEYELLFADGVAEKAKANIPSLRRVEVIAGVGHGPNPERVRAAASVSGAWGLAFQAA